MKIKTIAIALAILAFFFFVCSPFYQAANAVVLVDDAVIAILVAALAACGITLITTSDFGTLEQYVQQLFTRYVDSKGTTISQELLGVQYGRNKLGQILVNNRFLVLVDGFITWLKAYLGLTNNSSVTIQQSGYFLGDLQVGTVPFGGSKQWTTRLKMSQIVDNDRVTDRTYVVGIGNYWYLFSLTENWILETLSTEENGVETITAQNSYTLGDYSYNLNATKVIDPQYFKVVRISKDINSTFQNGVIWDNAPPNYQDDNSDLSWDIVIAINTFNAVSRTEGIIINTGSITKPTDDEGYTDGKGAILDVGGTWGATINEIIDETIPSDYSYDNEGSADMSLVDESEIVDEVESDKYDVMSDQAEDYQVSGLQSVFPFCIPFDIYAFFECLAAEPEAPSFTWRFYVPGICDEEIELDLSQFDTVAQIVRTMELLAFIVGLAFVTRDKMIKG